MRACVRACVCDLSLFFKPGVGVCVCACVCARVRFKSFFFSRGRVFFEIEVFTFGGVRLNLKQDNNSGVTGTLEPWTPLFTGR